MLTRFRFPFLTGKQPVVVACVAALLTACASSTYTVTRVDQSTLYSPQEIRAGGLQTFVYGSPVKGATPEEIVDPIEPPARIGGGRLIAQNVEDHGPTGARLILLFNGGIPTAQEVCSQPEMLRGAEGTGAVNVFAVYCLGPKWVARGHLTGVTISGLDDPIYSRSMRSLLSAVFPPRPPTDQRNDYQ